MDKPRLAKDFSEYQDVFGHLVMHRLYTPICLCFTLQDASSKSRIIDTLTKGLKQLSVSFPWVAGQVVIEGVTDGNAGISMIVPLDKTSRLIVKDLTHDAAVPSMDALRKANFPFSMLDGALLAPLKGVPTCYEEDPAPVFFIQANFINGGLILIFAGEHSAMDGQGLGQVMRILSKACHDESFTDEELLQGNRARNDIVPLLDQTTYKIGPELDHLLVKAKDTPPPASDAPPPKCAWAYFHFPASSLSRLKSIAASSSSTSDNPTVPYITTNDAVSAFIWQSTSRARSARLPPQTTSTIGRAVDVRSCLSIPPCYMGNMLKMSYSTFVLSSLSSASLGSIAVSLRSALNPVDLRYAIRSLATQITLAADKSSISFGADMDLSTDMFLSSWAKMPCYGLDFNLGLGFPESVRRPRYDVVEGLMYLMPTDRSGGVAAAICLRDEDLERLRADLKFAEYAEWVG